MKKLSYKIIVLLSVFGLVPKSYGQPGLMIAPLEISVTGEVAPGYIFMTSSAMVPIGDYPTSLMLLDSVGTLVFYWANTTETGPLFTQKWASDFGFQPDGMMSFISNSPNQIGRYFFMDSTFNLIDSFDCNFPIYIDPHEVIRLPNGNHFGICIEDRPMDLSAFTTIYNQPGDTSGTLRGMVITEFDSNGNVLVEWHSLDAYPVMDTYFHYFRNPSNLDHTHSNSIAICADGNIITSSRHLNAITKINRTTGQTMWTLGGKSNDFTFVNDTTPFTGQHYAREMDNGNILLYDNADFSSTPIARAVEYAIDTVNWTATMVWEHKNPFGVKSNYMGNAQRLPNGNTFINWAGCFPQDSTIDLTEIKPDQTEVLSIDFVTGQIAYRASKHELPFELPRPHIDCNPNTMQLTAPAGHHTYYWSTGDTTQSITVVDTGSYHVFVNQGIGYLCSETFQVDDLNALCGPVGIAAEKHLEISIFPNPSDGTIWMKNAPANSTIVITDMIGRTVFTKQKADNVPLFQLDLNHLQKGTYLIRSEDFAGRVILK